MYRLEYLTKENALNKIIRANKQASQKMNILFVSLWDERSMELLAKLEKKYGDNAVGQPIYIVDSFHMPHSFVIYNTTKLPHLVHINNKGPHSEDWLSMIEKTLKVN